MEPTYFATPAEFRAWLEAHHTDSPELLVGFYKKSSVQMRPSGLAAFALRSEAWTRVYSHEQAEEPALTPEEIARFAANPAAWDYFSDRPPWYRRAAIWWVISAKRAETRERRLDTLIADSASGVHVKPLRRPMGGA